MLVSNRLGEDGESNIQEEADVSQELSLHLERRVATQVVYLRRSVPGRSRMLLPGTVIWL